MIKTIVVAMLLLSISITSAAAKDKKKVEPQKVAVESLQPHILGKFTSCKDAKAAGISNVPVTPSYTPPGWRRSADADNDGVACEKNSFRYEEAMLRRFLVVLTTLGLLVGASPIAQGQR